MPQDLRSFLHDYCKLYPEELLRIEQPIDYRYEATALVAKLEREKRFPVLVFADVRRDGEKFGMPVITWEAASRLRMARLLGTTVERAGVACYEAMQQRKKPVVVPKSEAPVKEVVQRGDEVDLHKLPAPVHHEMDPGPYITAGFLTTYDPDSHRENSALQRGWIKGRNEIRVYLNPHTHNAINLRKYEARNEPTRVAYWIGHHPLAVLGAEMAIPYDDSHYETAGGFLGEPLRLVPSESLRDDFLVPADAEVVIEGVIPPGERRPEGPFGEYTRHNGQQRWGPYIRVTAVTHRHDAYWQDVMVGYTHWLSSLAHEGAAFDTIKRTVPSVANVHLPMSGCGLFNLYIQIRKTAPGQGKMALLAGLTSNFLIKHAFVFDEDINIFDDKEVLIGLATRFQGDRDIVVVTDCAGPSLDPSGGAESMITKMGFDCTKPLYPEPFATRLCIPGEVMERVKLEDFVSRERLGQIPFEIYG